MNEERAAYEFKARHYNEQNKLNELQIALQRALIERDEAIRLLKEISEMINKILYK